MYTPKTANKSVVWISRHHNNNIEYCSKVLNKMYKQFAVFPSSGLQYLKEKPQEAVVPGEGSSKLTLPQRTAEELGGADPDVQICYCIEATFMDIISSTLHGL